MRRLAILLLCFAGCIIAADDTVTDGTRARDLNWTQAVMRGRKHGFEPEFHIVVGQWARGEKMDEVPPKPVAPAPANR